MQNKKKEKINISTLKIHQMLNKWQYVTCIKVSLLNQNLQNDIVGAYSILLLRSTIEHCPLLQKLYKAFLLMQNT